jgi:SpoVK/Ycf46/Vps4 family AAA+-type ATPase
LFAGPSGTGKTMAAEVLARELGLDLYTVDLATVVDKYVGETEKNLDRIFAEAERVNGVILFDEADALFGKRSEVSDAHDRYANVEVAYLLQRMELFDGIAILATNLRSNLDEAFTRRLDSLVDFPEPEEEYRLKLWERSLGTAMPRAGDLDLAFLAESFKLAGGGIRNIVVAAAYAAAEQGQPLSMAHLIRATQREYLKVRGGYSSSCSLSSDSASARWMAYVWAVVSSVSSSAGAASARCTAGAAAACDSTLGAADDITRSALLSAACSNRSEGWLTWMPPAAGVPSTGPDRC